MSKKSIILTAFLLLAIVLMPACSGRATTPETEAPAQDTETPAEETPETEAPEQGKYNEAPMLAALVEAGELPPVDERLPVNPLVVEPVEEIGQYGGTWRSFDMNGDPMNHTWLAVNEPLLKWKRDASGFRLNIVDEYTYNDDYTQLTMHIREGMRWSDGEPVTVDDYIWFWEEMVLNENVPVRPPEGTVSGDGELMQVEKVDDFTLTFTFSQPEPLFLDGVSRNRHFSARHIVPSHYLEQFHPDFSDAEDGNTLFDIWNQPLNYPDLPTLAAWRTVEFESGQRAVMERNPYYWKVDPEGNQLPYIDRLEIELGQAGTGVDLSELIVLKSISGELDMQVRVYNQPDIPTLLENQESGDYRVIMWRIGNVGSPLIKINFGYKDDDIVDLFYCQDFRIALSDAIDRERINDVTALGLGEVRQFSMLQFEPQFQSEEGRAFYEEWRDSYTELDPDTAAELLDSIGVVDRDGDGWRDRPEERLNLDCSATGEANPNVDEPLEIVIDVIHGAAVAETMDLVRQDWEAIGIKTVVNQMEQSAFNERERNRESMMVGWGNAVMGGMMSSPGGWAPIRGFPGGFAGNMVGLWYQTGGEEGIPPREGSALVTLTEIYDKARQEGDEATRNDIVMEAYKLLAETGPWSIGTIGDFPSPVVVSNQMRNVPDFGIVGGWHQAFPASANPEQFFFVQE